MPKIFVTILVAIGVAVGLLPIAQTPAVRITANEPITVTFSCPSGETLRWDREDEDAVYVSKLPWNYESCDLTISAYSNVYRESRSFVFLAKHLKSKSELKAILSKTAVEGGFSLAIHEEGQPIWPTKEEETIR